MNPEAIKELRKELECTAKELAGALGLDQETILAWERGDLFPTKRFVTEMEALRAKGKSAIVRKPKRAGKTPPPMTVLSDPEMWRLVRKLVAHADLRREAQKLAEAYSDPAEDSGTP